MCKEAVAVCRACRAALAAAVCRAARCRRPPPPTADCLALRRPAAAVAAAAMEDQVLLPPNIEEIPPPGLALVEELDKLLLVQVRGGVGPAGRAVQRAMDIWALVCPCFARGIRLGVLPYHPPAPLPQLRDGRKIIGTLRSFDQFANLVLQGAAWLLWVGQPASASVEEAPEQLAAHDVPGSCCSRLAQQLPELRSAVHLPCCRCRCPRHHPCPSLTSLQSMHCAGAKERIIVGSQYAEIPLGLHVVRWDWAPDCCHNESGMAQTHRACTRHSPAARRVCHCLSSAGTAPCQPVCSPAPPHPPQG